MLWLCNAKILKILFLFYDSKKIKKITWYREGGLKPSKLNITEASRGVGLPKGKDDILILSGRSLISNTFWLPNTYLRKRKLTTLITDCKFTLSADNFLGFIILVLIYFWNGKSMSKMKSSIHVWKRKSCHIFNPVAKISGKLENCKATMQTKITHFVERWLQRLSIHSKFFEFPPPSSKVHWLFYALFGSLLSFVLIKL